MSRFLLGMRTRTRDRRHGWRHRKHRAYTHRPRTAFAKLPAANGNGNGSEAHRKPSRATRVLLAQRLREIRERKGLSQGDISRLMVVRRAYISRVESAEHMPPLRILQRWARVLEVPLYQLFYGGKTPPERLQILTPEVTTLAAANGSHGRYFGELGRLLRRLTESERKFLLEMAEAIHRRRSRGVFFAQRKSVSRAI